MAAALAARVAAAGARRMVVTGPMGRPPPVAGPEVPVERMVARPRMELLGAPGTAPAAVGVGQVRRKDWAVVLPLTVRMVQGAAAAGGDSYRRPPGLSIRVSPAEVKEAARPRQWTRTVQVVQPTSRRSMTEDELGREPLERFLPSDRDQG